MEIFKNAEVIWFILGFVFLLLEFVVPGLILFFFAAGAWITGIVLLFSDISINTQLIIFLASSIVSILLFRKGLRKLMWSRQNTSEIEDELLGKIGIAATFIGPGQNGKIEFKGTSWDARSDDTIEKGENVIIIGNDSILLIVTSTKKSA